MKFTIDDFEVTVIPGKPEVTFFNDGNNNYRQVTFSAPEDLIHPAFRKQFEEYVRRCSVKFSGVFFTIKKQKEQASLVHYVPSKKLEIRYLKGKLRDYIEEMVGDIEKAKDDWDYNRAPAGAVVTGRFGDLKAFLESRAGRKLNTGAIK